MSPPPMFATSPSSQSTSRITRIVQSIRQTLPYSLEVFSQNYPDPPGRSLTRQRSCQQPSRHLRTRKTPKTRRSSEMTAPRPPPRCMDTCHDRRRMFKFRYSLVDYGMRISDCGLDFATPATTLRTLRLWNLLDRKER